MVLLELCIENNVEASTNVTNVDDNSVKLVVTDIVVLLIDGVIFVVRGVDCVVEMVVFVEFVQRPQIIVYCNSCKMI